MISHMHVLLLRCHGVGTQCNVRGLDFLGHKSSLRSGVDHPIPTIPLHVPTSSGPSAALPLPLPPTPPSLCVGTLSEYLRVVLLPLWWPSLLQGLRLWRDPGGAGWCWHCLCSCFHGQSIGRGHQTCPWSFWGSGGAWSQIRIGVETTELAIGSAS